MEKRNLEHAITGWLQTLPNMFKATKVNHPRQLSTQTVQENAILFFPGLGQDT